MKGRRFVLVSVSVALLGACAGKAPTIPPSVPPSASNEIESTVFLVGDGGKPRAGGDPVLDALTEQIGETSRPTVVVFLGDNVYHRGLPSPGAKDRLEMERRLVDQMGAVLKTKARGILVPGNHDWDNGKQDGWNAIRRQGELVREHGEGRIELLPEGGCPGPAVVDIGGRLRLIAVDTQWWFHAHEKPGAADCAPGTERTVTATLSQALAEKGARIAVVVAHHPLLSSGSHGGYFNWQDHLFPLTRAWAPLWIPLPGVGSLYPLLRIKGATSQDQPSSGNERMRAALEASFDENPPLIYAAGHEHTLEVLAGGRVPHLLVSGAGYFGHTSPTKWRPETKYQNAASGFMRLDILTTDAIRLGVLTVSKTGKVSEPYAVRISTKR